jgi:hypothetical protein
MESQLNMNATKSFSFFSLLGLLFIGLKLTGYITWSWWIVLLPFYGPLAATVVVLLVFAIIAGLFI